MLNHIHKGHPKPVNVEEYKIIQQQVYTSADLNTSTNTTAKGLCWRKDHIHVRIHEIMSKTLVFFFFLFFVYICRKYSTFYAH